MNQSTLFRGFLALFCLWPLCGCVERKVTITTQPEGALVFFGEDEIGRTPLTIPFTFYGDREVIVRKEGFETLHTHADLEAPCYDAFPLDFFSELLTPWTYHYHVHEHYALAPLQIPDEQELIRQAGELKREAQALPEK